MALRNSSLPFPSADFPAILHKAIDSKFCRQLGVRAQSVSIQVDTEAPPNCPRSLDEQGEPSQERLGGPVLIEVAHVRNDKYAICRHPSTGKRDWIARMGNVCASPRIDESGVDVRFTASLAGKDRAPRSQKGAPLDPLDAAGQVPMGKTVVGYMPSKWRDGLEIVIDKIGLSGMYKAVQQERGDRMNTGQDRRALYLSAQEASGADRPWHDIIRPETAHQAPQSPDLPPSPLPTEQWVVDKFDSKPHFASLCKVIFVRLAQRWRMSNDVHPMATARHLAGQEPWPAGVGNA